MAPSTTAFLAAGAAPIGGRVLAAAAATCRSPLGVSAFTPARTAAAAPPPPPASFLAPMTALMPGFPTSDTDKGLRVGVIRTRWGGEMVDALHEQVVAGLTEAGLEGESVVEMTVPGAFEVPMAARLMGLAQKVDAIVVVGLLVQGETGHYEYISKAVTGALMELQLISSIPIVNGILTCTSTEQAAERTTGPKSQAKAWAEAAVEMGGLRSSQVGAKSRTTNKKPSVGFF
ncbi:hypothetical protein BU14_0027s0045 [Porphyra umbilicalis]|uniref:6,7-dimethyl-8-ribityllumazine synthase n=1 Tax=Porphyra umbilicalis TaxID=2786 RepID=A0A1X6PJM4_PORUM|nr:hypothetical protein BU14_0027s0045 [Porphyra umbilicalis]|eukprot:OSX81020.1 hypothetical protein BU14_0027s0045 [Porphyra umbilicalis]